MHAFINLQKIKGEGKRRHYATLRENDTQRTRLLQSLSACLNAIRHINNPSKLISAVRLAMTRTTDAHFTRTVWKIPQGCAHVARPSTVGLKSDVAVPEARLNR